MMEHTHMITDATCSHSCVLQLMCGPWLLVRMNTGNPLLNTNIINNKGDSVITFQFKQPLPSKQSNEQTKSSKLEEMKQTGTKTTLWMNRKRWNANTSDERLNKQFNLKKKLLSYISWDYAGHSAARVEYKKKKKAHVAHACSPNITLTTLNCVILPLLPPLSVEQWKKTWM